MGQLRSVAELSRELGVSQPQIHMWYARRARNGFPECKGRVIRRTTTGRLREARVWDRTEVRRWRRGYVPARGGRPSFPSTT